MAQDLPTSKSLRAGYEVAGIISKWDNEKYPMQRGYPPHDVLIHCVQHSAWQRTRLSMKGKKTYIKLEILVAWIEMSKMREMQIAESDSDEATKNARIKALRWQTEVQVGNYLGALRRGGQLGDDNQIRKEI